MEWCFSDEGNDLSRAILSRLSNLADIAIVPDLWFYEVANVIELASRKGRISEQQAAEFLKTLADLPIDIETPDMASVFDKVRELAGKHKLTTYDAAYLEIALRQKLPIATFDQALAKAARNAGVGLVEC